MRALPTVIALAALLALVPAARADDGTDGDGDGALVERGELVVAPGRRPIGGIAIENLLGDVRIEGYDGDSVSIVAVKHAPDARALERLRVVVIPDPDGTVRLSTALLARDGRPSTALAAVRIDLTVRVPRAVKITGRVSTGRLSVQNVDAGADLDASTGPIVVRNVAGVVFARSLAGSQRFEEVFGSLDSHAIDGDVSFDTVRGQALTAQVYQGDIEGRRVSSQRVKLSSIDGDIDLEAEPQRGGALTLTSLRGAVSLRVRPTVGLTVRARAGGKASVPGAVAGDDRWAEAQIGARKGGAAVRIESRFGDISFSLVQ